MFSLKLADSAIKQVHNGLFSNHLHLTMQENVYHSLVVSMCSSDYFGRVKGSKLKSCNDFSPSAF
jgi:hypothetical protein